MSAVTVNTYTLSVTYVADNILKSLKDVLRLSGLDPTSFVGDWDSNMRAVRAWLDTGDLEVVKLEIYSPSTDKLIFRWDLTISYSWSGGDGGFWTDTEALQYAIRKEGLAPHQARYRLLLQTKPGRVDVPGWGWVESRSTEGMVRQSLGSTIDHSGLGANASYLRRA